jgi:tetratricopeptide (TPR) repeat protein
MDSDDTMPPEQGRRLAELVSGDWSNLCAAPEGPCRQIGPVPLPSNVLGFVMQVHCPLPDEDGSISTTIVDHVKLFRNRPDLRFEHRIHEQILGAIRRAGGDVVFTDVHVIHSGADHSPEGKRKKLRRDIRLLKLDLWERPDHPFVLFNLGMTYHDAGRHVKAASALERCLAVSAEGDSHVRKAYALLIGSLMKLGRHDAAGQVCRQGRRACPQDAELLFREGLLAHQLGKLAEAEQAYLKALANEEPPHFGSIDRGVTGYKARHNLAAVYHDMGRLDLAHEQWRRIVEEEPLYADGWCGLGECLVAQGRLEEAAQLANVLVPQKHLRRVGLHVLDLVWERRGGNAPAERLDERGGASRAA